MVGDLMYNLARGGKECPRTAGDLQLRPGGTVHSQGVHFHNHERPHQSLDYRTPAEVHHAWAKCSTWRISPWRMLDLAIFAKAK